MSAPGRVSRREQLRQGARYVRRLPALRAANLDRLTREVGDYRRAAERAHAAVDQAEAQQRAAERHVQHWRREVGALVGIQSEGTSDGYLLSRLQQLVADGARAQRVADDALADEASAHRAAGRMAAAAGSPGAPERWNVEETVNRIERDRAERADYERVMRERNGLVAERGRTVDLLAPNMDTTGETLDDLARAARQSARRQVTRDIRELLVIQRRNQVDGTTEHALMVWAIGVLDVVVREHARADQDAGRAIDGEGVTFTRDVDPDGAVHETVTF